MHHGHAWCAGLLVSELVGFDLARHGPLASMAAIHTWSAGLHRMGFLGRWPGCPRSGAALVLVPTRQVLALEVLARRWPKR